MSLQINTNILGTYNVEYNATDESGNSITKNRNIFITPSITEPTIVLKSSPLPHSDKELGSAVKPGSVLDYIDRGFIAYDQYGNSSEDFDALKASVKIEHKRYDNKDDTTGVLIYSELNGISTYPNVPDNGPVTLHIKPKYLYLFKNGTSTPFYTQSNWSPSNEDYQTVYFTITYTLNIIGFSSKSVTRKIYITDVAPPAITLPSGIANPQQIEAGSNFEDITSFNTLENFWYFKNETLPSGYEYGFSWPLANDAPPGSILIRDPDNATKTSIDTQIVGMWKIYYTFYCVYSASINGANFVPYTIPIGDATGDPLERSYVLVRNVNVTDTTPPIVELKDIASESNPITFGSNNSGKIYTKNDDIYFWIPNNSSTKPTLQDIIPNIYVIGEFGSSSVPSDNAEIIIRDNAGSSQNFSVSANIARSVPNGTNTPFPLSRSLVGTDFNDNYDYNHIPIAGTSASPAEYIISYSVSDESGNNTNISRKLYIIDVTLPVIVFKNLDLDSSNPNDVIPVIPEYTNSNNGVIYQKNSTSSGQSNNIRKLMANNTDETTYQDEFGDIISKKVAFITSEIVPSYRKDRPQNVFLVSYNASTQSYVLKSFYNKGYEPGTTIRIATGTKENNVFFAPSRDEYPVYYFDLSHTSLANRPPILFVPSSNWGSGVNPQYVLPSQKTPQGTYHSFLKCDYTGANSEGGGGFLNDGNTLELREYVNGQWSLPSGNPPLDVTLETYDPNSTGEDGLDDDWGLD